MASAEQMLLEIQSESLQKLLTRVRLQSKSSRLMGIPSLDTYLSTGSAYELESPGNAIRIQGHPGSGKTHLLYFLVATSVLPLSHLSSSIGGWNKVAFVIDLDGHFQIARFREILIDRLKRSLVDAVSIPTIVDQCLKLVHVFRPTSSGQFAVTLAHLYDHHFKKFPSQELGMIAVHSIDAFYWLDRFKAEQLQSNSTTKITYSDTISAILADLRKSYGLTTVMTLWRSPQQNIHLNRPNHHPELANNADSKGLFFAPDLPEATLIIDSIPREEQSSHSTMFSWRGHAHSRPQTCVFSCLINDRGVVML